MEKFEEEKDKEIDMDDIFADIPLPKQEIQPMLDIDHSNDEDSRHMLADKIDPKVFEQKKKKKVVI